MRRNGHLIWGGVGVAAALVHPAATLGLHGDGFEPEPDVVADGLLGCLAQLPGLSRIDAYHRLVDQLRARFELDATNFVEFAYDWRLSCTVNAKLLAEQICPVLVALRRGDPDAGFVFVCHSMGGLVVQQFTDVIGGGPDTKEVITLGTPFRGAVKALGVLSEGWPPALPIIRSRLRNLALTLPSVHELLPRYRAIIDGPDLRMMRKGDLGGGTRSDELFERSSGFHDALDIDGPRPYGRTVIVGSLQPTAQFAQMRDGQVDILERWDQASGILDQRGDGTVPRQSVTPPEWRDDRHAIPLAETHIGLPTSDSVFRVLFNSLTVTPRQEQAELRAKLAIAVSDLVSADTDVDVRCEVVEGDRDVPMLVQVDRLDATGMPRFETPLTRDGQLIASFRGLPRGDYKVSLKPAVAMPDIRPVWDALTVVDPALEAS